ncbi:hypothetical protein STAS_34327 [Striga asiatica]|uniref:KIB1-4 beta-propeller domain-containing protein n=1 Tax=Striga asiatica TaxID=4170 RepID=A0A5A7RHA4_STRAF|nr:hypothetical protein STAS_34327 [Striga asiatica]
MASTLLRRRYSNFLSRVSTGMGNPSSNSGAPYHYEQRRMCTLRSTPRTPLLVLPPVSNGGNLIYRFYNPAAERIESVSAPVKHGSDLLESEIVGSSHGWLALFNLRNNSIVLSNPFTHRQINLPPVHTLPDPEINLTDGRGRVSKVVLSCCPDEDEEGCRAVMSYGPGERLAFCRPRRCTEWSPMEDSFFDGYKEEIRDYGVDYARIYEDFTYCPKREVFNCTTQFEVDLEDWSIAVPTQFEVWDLLSDPHSFKSKTKSIYWHLIDIKGPKCPWIEENMDIVKTCRQIPYLVNDNHGDRDRLFLVIRFVIQRACINRPFADVDSIPYDPVSDRLMVHLYPHKTIGFSVVEIHFETRPANGRINGLSRIVGGCGNSLDGLAMFIGMNHSFVVSSAADSGLKPNCIYFTDSNKHQVPLDSIYGGHDIGIFDYENKTLSPCYYPCDVRSYRGIVPTPVWLTPSAH